MSEEFYDGQRMTGQRDQIANSCVQAVARMAQIGISQMDEAPEKVVFLCGTAIPGLAGIALIFAHPDRQEAMFNHQKPDDLAFGALYMIAASEEHPDGICCGWSPLILAKACEMFKTLFGRDYTNLNPALVEMIKERQERASVVPSHLKKFLPH